MIYRIVHSSQQSQPSWFYFNNFNISQNYQQIQMIPLSNGRSPRIDQYYATVRALKTTYFEQQLMNGLEQQRSIQHIKTLGNEILEWDKKQKKSTVVKSIMNELNRSAGSIEKPRNLYDKYKHKETKKISDEMNHMIETVGRQETQRKAKKPKQNSKYEKVSPKLNVDSGLKGLNYTKRIDMQVKQLKKQQNQIQEFQKHKKEKQFYFTANIQKTNKWEHTLSGVLKRSEELELRKKKDIEKWRQVQIRKEMEGITFEPRKISKQIQIVEEDFLKRNSLSSTQKIQKSRQVIQQSLEKYTFNPQTNLYKRAQSKIIKAWKEDGRKKQSRQENKLQKSIEKAGRSVSYVTINSLNEISFIFNQKENEK